MNVATIECSRCGSLAQVQMSTLLVEVDGPEPTDDRIGGTVVWICQTCVDLVAIPIAWAVLLSLVAAGAHLVEEHLEVDVLPAHPEHPPPGPAFTSDDLLDLYVSLTEPDWLDQLMTLVDSACSEGPQ
jgi:hypothetical protein